MEFRQYHSSLNANKIWAWIVFTQMIVSAAKGKRGKAKRRVVNTGNHLTAKERGMILDLGMHNFIDPWSGAENYDDITMSALRLLATRKRYGLAAGPPETASGRGMRNPMKSKPTHPRPFLKEPTNPTLPW